MPDIDPLSLDLNDLRQRVLAGEVIAPEITRAALDRLRQGRKTSTVTAVKSGRSTKSRSMTDDELDADLAAFGL